MAQTICVSEFAVLSASRPAERRLMRLTPNPPVELAVLCCFLDPESININRLDLISSRAPALRLRHGPAAAR
jgi:hypothetical protein